MNDDDDGMHIRNGSIISLYMEYSRDSRPLFVYLIARECVLYELSSFTDDDDDDHDADGWNA